MSETLEQRRARVARETKAEELARNFTAKLAELRLPLPVREHRFMKGRQYRLDFAWPDHKLAVEVNGGIMAGEPWHTGYGHLRDMEKINWAQVMGWRVLQYTGGKLLATATLAQVARALTNNQTEPYV